MCDFFVTFSGSMEILRGFCWGFGEFLHSFYRLFVYGCIMFTNVECVFCVRFYGFFCPLCFNLVIFCHDALWNYVILWCLEILFLIFLILSLSLKRYVFHFASLCQSNFCHNYEKSADVPTTWPINVLSCGNCFHVCIVCTRSFPQKSRSPCKVIYPKAGNDVSQVLRKT